MTDLRPYERLPQSRSAIDRAGRLLADRLVGVTALVDGDVLEAMDTLVDYRDAHRLPLERAVDQLRLAVGDDVVTRDVAYRLKRARRLIEKLARFPTMRLTSMQDIAGCRAVLPDLSGVGIVRERLLDAGLVVLREDDYNATPRASGYRAHHLIARVDGAPVEIQFRTTWQQAWTNRVERLDTDYNVGLKHERGPVEVREYLAVLAYAEQERHLTGFLAPDAEEELERLEAAALAVLPQRKATR